MCAPLVDAEGTAMGVVQVDTQDMQRQFNDQDLEVLASVVPSAATALRYCQLHEEALKRQALDRDLKLARRVQNALLPEAAPRLEGYQFFAFYEAAYEVGGDYYDYVPLPGGRWAVVVADAVGKGVSAALLMAKLSGELRSSLSIEPTPAAAVARMNDSMTRSGMAGHFVTLILAVIDPATHQVNLVNAGHMAPLVRRADGFVDEAPGVTGGPALGILPNQDYAARSVRLDAGDSVTMFTDGFSEAARADNAMYGVERLRGQLAVPVGTAKELGERVLSDVRRFVGGHPQSDDMCLICFGREGRP
jgi:serine phosphatase RsbU (regulator of sigma subunit)